MTEQADHASTVHWMRAAEAAAYLGVDARTFSYWKRQRGMPFHRAEDRELCLFVASELDQWRRNDVARILPPPRRPRQRQPRYRPHAAATSYPPPPSPSHVA